MTGRFVRALRGERLAVPPIWMMRQAGRYHAPYQRLRARYSFDTLCRTPELAAEVAMGPVDDFDFDAAILFSDLLYPLEALGFGLSYDHGAPALDRRLTAEDLGRLRPLDEAVPRLWFQAEAVRATRARLARDKGLIGFIGGPWTLFVYAMEGTHAGELARAKASLDLYRAFADRLAPLIEEQARMQLSAGADLVMVFDTAAGELPPAEFRAATLPDLARLSAAFPRRLGYYGRGLQAAHLNGASDRSLLAQPWAGLGYDWRWDLASVFTGARPDGFVQGNFDPACLALEGAELERALDGFLAPLSALDAETRRGWICGLGHGVVPETPQSSVRRFVTRVRETFV